VVRGCVSSIDNRQRDIHGSEYSTVKNLSDYPIYKTGSYVGNDAADRAITHDLGIVPSVILIFDRDTGYECCITKGSTHLNWIGNSTGWTVTAPTASTFNVGNAGSYSHSMNANLVNYDWIAFR
jgi:hypothetical protein